VETKVVKHIKRLKPERKIKGY